MVTWFLGCLHTALTWAGHAPLQVPQRLPGQRSDLVPEPPLAVQRQVPETRLPLAVPALQVAGLAEAAVEAKVVTDAVLPAVRGRLEEGEVLSRREAAGGGGSVAVLAARHSGRTPEVAKVFTFIFKYF